MHKNEKAVKQDARPKESDSTGKVFGDLVESLFMNGQDDDEQAEEETEKEPE